MKVRDVTFNNRRQAFLLDTGDRVFPYPYVRCVPAPSPSDPVREVFVDAELAGEAITYRLASGAEGSIHIEQALDHNRDPEYLRKMLLYRLTLEARERIEKSGLSKREIIRRLETSPAQLYRLLDPSNERKSLDKMVGLLSVLECDVDLVVRERSPIGERRRT